MLMLSCALEKSEGNDTWIIISRKYNLFIFPETMLKVRQFLVAM
jgi:hypothetical protein